MKYEFDRGVRNVSHTTPPDALVSRDQPYEVGHVYAQFDLGKLAIVGEMGYTPLQRPDDGDYAILVENPNVNNSGDAVLMGV